MKSLAILFIAFVSLATAISIGDTACISAGLNLRSAPCGAVSTVSHGSETGKVTAIQKQTCSFGTYTWIQIAIPGFKGMWGAMETGLIKVCNPVTGFKNITNVPYVHQVLDTPDSFAGGWACGPTSAVMAAAHYGKIKAHPITVSRPYSHTNNFGWYVSSVYTSPTGFVFNRMQKDAHGNAAYGAYGTCTDGGGAWAWRIQDYLKNHGLSTKFYDAASPTIIKSAIDAGHMVILSTQLTSAGHIIAVKGYRGTSVLANDPYGNANVGGYGTMLNGADVEYTWQFVRAKWCVEVWQPSSQEEFDASIAAVENYLGKQ